MTVNSRGPACQRCLKGAPNLRNLVAHQSKRIWLPCDISVHLFSFRYIPTLIHLYICRSRPICWKIREQHHYHMYIWPVSCDHIAGSGSELVICFFFKLTADQVLVFPVDQRLKRGIYSGEKEGVWTTAKKSECIKSRHILFYFSSDIFLA